MSENYNIYDLENNLLEKVDNLSNCHYGKPAFSKEHAEHTGKKCYFKIIPYSPLHINSCKEVHQKRIGGDAMWCLMFDDPLGGRRGQNVVLIRNEHDVRPSIEKLAKRFDIPEDDFKVMLKPIW